MNGYCQRELLAYRLSPCSAQDPPASAPNFVFQGKAEPCDCLNLCGDDPGLRDGRAIPCATLSKERAEHEEIENLASWAEGLAEAYHTGPNVLICRRIAVLLRRYR